LIENNLFLSNDIVDFDKLVRIYKYAPIEAFRFEKFCERHRHSTDNTGFLQYRYSIKDLGDIDENSKESYDHQIDKFAKKARQESMYYMHNRVNSYNAGNPRKFIERAGSGLNKDEDDVLRNLHCWNCGLEYKDRIFNFRFQC
jgi:hypothetical protein